MIDSKLPAYRSHKIVRAAKIVGFRRLDGEATQSMVIAAGGENLLVDLPKEWFLRHRPEIDGYYVVYDDGYQSFSPAKAFEDGYTLLDQPTPTLQQRVIAEKAALDDDLQRLVKFQGVAAFFTLHEEEQDRLIAQSMAMADYSKVLGERIAAFD